MVLNNITYFPILGLPLTVYIGIITLTLFLFAALVASMVRRGDNRINFKWHSRLAKIGIIFAIIHAALGILAYV